MYYPYFVAYITLGIVISLLVFFWALKTGQFNDQKRARFLPLEEEPEIQGGRIPRKSRFSRFEFYALGGLVCAGLAASATVLVLALTSGP